ncbi:MAG: hypothetical protein QM627_00110 [Luteolibacter sp.]
MTTITTPLGQAQVSRLSYGDEEENFLNEGLILAEENGRQLKWGDHGFRAEMTEMGGTRPVVAYGFTELGAVASAMAQVASAWALSQPEIVA